MTPARIDKLRRLAKEASPGPWKTGEGYEQSEPGNYIASANGLIVAAEVDRTDCVLSRADRDLIVCMRNNLEALLDIAEGKVKP